MKLGLPALAADYIHNSGEKSLQELTGLGKQFLPVMRECQASFREIQVAAARRSARPEDLRHLCARNLDGDSLDLLEELAHYNALGRVLRYVESQRELYPCRQSATNCPISCGFTGTSSTWPGI